MDGLKCAEAEIQKVGSPHLTGLEADEFGNASAMLLHACRRGMWKLDTSSQSKQTLAEDLRRVIAEHERLWLIRNRPGGLSDSSGRLRANLDEYER